MSRGARREGLSRRHRFRGEDAFRAVLRGGRKFTANLAVLHVAPSGTPAARFGISVGRRAAKSAVERNRIKRRARDLFRRHSLKQSKADVVVTLTSRFDVTQLDHLIVELAALFDAARARMPD